MATISAMRGSKLPNTCNLSTNQGGNGQSTNVTDVGGWIGPSLLKLTCTVGATPTVTVAFEGSADGVNWWNVPYALVSTPATVTVANVTITTAGTSLYLLQVNAPWRFFRLTYSANTNVTTTADLYVF